MKNNRNLPPLYEGAAVLLPGLLHARSLIDTAILICDHYARQSPHHAAANEALTQEDANERLAENVEKTRALLAAFARSPGRAR